METNITHLCIVKPNYLNYMKITFIIARVLLGALYVFAALNYFFQLTPQEAPTGTALTFAMGLGAAGYFMPFLKVLELLCGIAFITGQYVSLAAVVIFPVTVNILLFHAFLAPETVIMSIFMLGLNLFIAWRYRGNYSMVFARR